MTTTADIIHTPDQPTDWDGNVDAGSARDHIDQLASRLTSGHMWIGPYPPVDTDKYTVWFRPD